MKSTSAGLMGRARTLMRTCPAGGTAGRLRSRQGVKKEQKHTVVNALDPSQRNQLQRIDDGLLRDGQRGALHDKRLFKRCNPTNLLQLSLVRCSQHLCVAFSLACSQRMISLLVLVLAAANALQFQFWTSSGCSGPPSAVIEQTPVRPLEKLLFPLDARLLITHSRARARSLLAACRAWSTPRSPATTLPSPAMPPLT